MVDYEYVGFGAGVDSTAMLYFMFDNRDPVDIIFVDTGLELSKTIEHKNLMKKVIEKEGWKFIELKPEIKKDGKIFTSGYDYLLDQKIIPYRNQRECTRKFKLEPVHRYIRKKLKVDNLRGKKVIEYIGYNYSEKHRAKDYAKWQIRKYPLIENRISSEGCKRICFNKIGYVPIPSRCFICPFQSRSMMNESIKDKRQEFFNLMNANQGEYITKNRKLFPVIVNNDRSLDEFFLSEGEL